MTVGTHELPVSLFQWLDSSWFQLHCCSTLLTNVGIVEGEQLEHANAQWFVDIFLVHFILCALIYLLHLTREFT